MRFDAVIVGSGAGGGTAAWELTRKGLRVCLMERGPRFDPESDYILNYRDWDQRKDPLKDALYNEQTIDMRYRTPVEYGTHGNARDPFSYNRVQGVGGSTLHYQGEAHRFAEHTFRTKSLFGWGVDWPLEYSDLAPYYDKMERVLGVAGEAGNPFKPERGRFPTPAHGLSEKSRILAASARRAGMRLQPNTLALPSISVDGRPPCQHSGGCNYGCIFNAKSSVDQTLIPAAERTGRLQLMTNTRAMTVRTDGQGRVSGIECLQEGEIRVVSAKVYLLAAGAIETPRLLFNSPDEYNPGGLGNQYDQLGRYLMETVLSILPIRLSNKIPTYRGPPIDARIWDYCHPVEPGISGFVLGTAGYLDQATGPASFALAQGGLGRAHKQRVRETFGRSVDLFGIAEQEPLRSNRLFTSERTDHQGVPKVKVHCAYSERDLHTLENMNTRLLEWAHATDTEYVGPIDTTMMRAAATHVAGTCRMGDDPRKSVVDGFSRVHGQKNLYITDASILPTQGAGDSPSLTIQALALRAAERIAAGISDDEFG